MRWVTERLEEGDAPRATDVVERARSELGWTHLTAAKIRARLRLHPSYLLNSAQQGRRLGSRRYRPIVTKALGQLHCDLGFFARSRDYETPVTYRSGFLAAKDVLSRYTYAVVLRKSKSAPALVKAFETLLERHASVHSHRVTSVSFDREPGIMSKEVQQFFRDRHIVFHPFKYSASKAKHSENAIRLIRTAMARQLRARPGKRWWQLLDDVTASLNARKIVVNGKTLPFRPSDVNRGNLARFLEILHKSAPSLYWAQFALAPDLVRFRYPVGTIVRPKLLATSSAVLGTKRSEVNVETNAFVVTEQVPYLSARRTVERAYRCELLPERTETEIFEESDLTESVE